MDQIDASPSKATSTGRGGQRTTVRFVIVGAAVALLSLVGLHLMRGGGSHVVDLRTSWSSLSDESFCRTLSTPFDVTVTDGNGRIVGSARDIRGQWDGGKCAASTKITVFDADMYSFRMTWTNSRSGENGERVNTISRAELESKDWVF